MSAPDAALVISTIASPVVAIAVSVIGYNAVKSAARTAKETADADRGLEHERLRAEKTRDHTASFLRQRTEAYERVLAAFSEWERLGQKEDFDHERLNEIYNGLGVGLPRLALFGRPVYEDVHLWQRHLSTYINSPHLDQGRVMEAVSAMHDLEGRISGAMSNTMGADLDTL